mmetsp:Transcript_51319/g.76662  ORF Transcript_51319/g.76662 Transcript_51319/m.76662 type:complete len:202 (+) Transcript_51319:34-639(+)
MSIRSTAAMTASPISLHPTILHPSFSCLMSAVRTFSSKTASTACSINKASSGRSKSYLSIMAALRIIAKGLALSSPAMSGALPWHGSNTPGPSSPILADGSIPSDPTNILASSLRMSPKMLPQTIVSNCFGHRISCMAALSTYICESSTSEKSLVMTSVTTSRHNCDTSKTFALSTEHNLPSRLLATSPATRAIRSISFSL